MSNSNITLNFGNYYKWSQNTETILQVKSFMHHLTYDNLDLWLAATYEQPPREILFNNALDAIDINVANLNDQQIVDAKLALEKRFHDLPIWHNTIIKKKEQWKSEVEQIKGILRSTIDPQFWQAIKDLPSILQMWNQLRIETHQEEAGNIAVIMQAYYAVNYQESEKLTNWIARVETFRQRLRELNRPIISEEMVFYKILTCLPPKYDQIQQAIYQLPADQMTIAVLKTKFAHEDARQAQKSTPQAKPLNTKQDRPREAANATQTPKAPPRKCISCQKPIDNMFPKFTRCLGCHSTWKADNKPAYQKKDKPPIKEEKTSLAYAFTTKPQDQQWILDSGCSAHMKTNTADMTNLQPSQTQIQVASGDLISAESEGTLRINSNGRNFDFNKTLVVPNLTQNLMSVKRIAAASPDMYIIFNGTNCQIFKGQLEQTGEILLEGAINESGLYAMNNISTADHQSTETTQIFEQATTNTLQFADSTIVTKTLQEYHEDWAHISKEEILAIARDDPAINIANQQEEINCPTCAEAKLNQSKFADKIPPRATQAGETIYSDICGPISPSTILGERYLIHFLDEFSGFIFSFLLKHKSEAFNLFKQVRAKLNNIGPSKVKLFVSDGGGEFTNNEFEDFLQKKGISHAIAPPNTPQRMGKSERLNKILLDSTRAMLFNNKMPLRFWGQAVLYATFIRNRQIKRDKLKSRNELLTGFKSSLKHCLPFGTPVVYNNRDRSIKKLDKRGYRGIFLGFEEFNYCYQILDIETNEIIQVRTIKPFPKEQIEYDNNDFNQPLITTDNNILTERGPQLPSNDATSIAESEEDLQLQIITENEDLDDNNLNQQIQPNNDNNINFNNNNDDLDDLIRRQQQYYDQLSDEEQIDLFDELIEHQPPQIIQPQDILPEIQVFIPEAEQQPPHRYPLRSRGLQAQILNNNNNFQELIHEPQTYTQAMNSKYSEQWLASIKEEQQSLIKHQAFKLVARPINKPIVRTRYVFVLKPNLDGKDKKFKTRIVAKGFSQTEGVDFFETFSPTLRMASFRILLSTATLQDFQITHLDVQTAFLNSELKEEVYMEIPEGFELGANRKTHVLQLLKSIYGLKQASRDWHETFADAIIQLGFKQSTADPCIFIKYDDQHQILAIIGIFVDDCYLLTKYPRDANDISNQLQRSFNMHDLGPLKFTLGIEVNQTETGISISQSNYIYKCLERFGMQEAKPTATPLPFKPQADQTKSQPFQDIKLYQQLIGSLMYLASATRPDIAYAVGYLARSMQSPTDADWINAKRVLRYLKGTLNYSLQYLKSATTPLFGYSDASYAEEKDYKSVGGYLFIQAGAAITWRSTKQDVVAQSSMEAEYIALAEAGKEAQWLRKLQQELSNNTQEPTLILEDNQSTIKLAKSPLHTSRSKHIQVRFHAIRDLIKTKQVQVRYCPTQDMVADIMTKSLGRVQQETFKAPLGLGLTL